MPLLDHFGWIAPFYDRAAGFNQRDRFIQLVGLPVEGVLLDAGGGTGRVAQALRDQAGFIVVADESLGMLAQAAAKGGLGAVASHSERLPFADDTFDAAIMVDALHHVADQRTSLAELWRLVRPGGRIVIEEPDIRTFGVKLIALFEKLALMRTHIISPEEIAGIFARIVMENGNPSAQIEIEREGYISWVIVEK